MSEPARRTRRDVAALLLAKVRQEPDLIGVVIRDQQLAFAYATRRSKALQAGEPCPICGGRAHVVFLLAPKQWVDSGAFLPRQVQILCPLCEGTGRLEREYSNFVDFYAAALPQDTGHLVSECGADLPVADVTRGDWINRAQAQHIMETVAC